MTNDYEHKMLKSVKALEDSIWRLTKAIYEQNKILEKLVPDVDSFVEVIKADMTNEEAINE